jgi:glucosylglycerate phosphorylase
MHDLIRTLLTQLYDDVDPVLADIEALIARYSQSENQQRTPLSERDVILITYGDTLQHQGYTPIQTLADFANRYLTEAFSAIHILPFYPYSSDDGFSVKDFYAVDPALGSWDDVQRLSQDFDLMFDAVFNHMSAQSEWFAQWLAGHQDYDGLFMTADKDADISQVVRPRALPLLTPFEQPDGNIVHVWTTFSADQVDFDIRHPATLLRLLDILLFYVAHGARFIRLDAIAFLWKQVGTPSIHLPQTHTAIQLMRAVLDAVAPEVVLITETNVPHAENISYFGDGHNEAQMVYNFTLPPLLLYTLITGDTSHLRTWVKTLQTPSDQTTFFNFMASHDGIGLRPVEGILDADELAKMIQQARSTGGRVSYKRNSDGTESPYELNVTYVDAVGGATPQEKAQRFLASQTIALSLAGVPGIYIHSLLGSTNDIEGMEATDNNRRINRAKLDIKRVEEELNTEDHLRHYIFNDYMQRIAVRTQHPAFHPNGTQAVIDVNHLGVFALLRTAPDGSQKILTITNVTPETRTLSDVITMPQENILTGMMVNPPLTLSAYQSVWLKIGVVDRYKTLSKIT